MPNEPHDDPHGAGDAPGCAVDDGLVLLVQFIQLATLFLTEGLQLLQVILQLLIGGLLLMEVPGGVF